MKIQGLLNISGIGRIDLGRYQPVLKGSPEPGPQPKPTPTRPMAPAPRPRPTQNQVNLLTFGGDRKQVVETLIASGAKGENPKVGFFGNVFRKIFGGTTTKKKQIGPNQTLTTKVRNKNFQVKELRLSTRDGGKTRHIDFHPGEAQVKDIGQVLARGEVKRMFSQDLSRDARGRTVITSEYFEPKTGRQFARVTEASRGVDVTKFGTVESEKKSDTFRQIELLGPDGRTSSRYLFDHASRNYRFERFDSNGQVASSYRLSSKMNFHKLVDRLTYRAPSGAIAGGGGGRRGPRTHVAHH